MELNMAQIPMERQLVVAIVSRWLVLLRLPSAEGDAGSSQITREERTAMNQQTKRNFQILGLTLVWACCAAALHAQTTIDQAIVMAKGGFPYNIKLPGSYRLTSNLTLPAGAVGDAIDINSDDVDLDLNGFAILGGGAGTQFPDIGVYAGQNNGVTYKNITVKNGAIRGFYEGVYMSGSFGLVSDVNVSGTLQHGFFVEGVTVERCTASYNLGAGINAISSTVSGFVANSNAQWGILVSNSTLTDSVAIGNQNGIEALNSTVIRNLADSNTQFGIEADHSLVGSNELIGNKTVDLSLSNSTTQNNNSCTAGTC